MVIKRINNKLTDDFEILLPEICSSLGYILSIFLSLIIILSKLLSLFSSKAVPSVLGVSTFLSLNSFSVLFIKLFSSYSSRYYTSI